MKILNGYKIINCFSCPKFLERQCLGSITGSTTDDVCTIPKWCELKDYKISFEKEVYYEKNNIRKA